MPRYRENNRIVLPIKNIGMGPALNITVWIVQLDEQGTPRDKQGNSLDKQTNPAEAEGKMGWFDSPLLGLGVQEMTTVMVYIPGLTTLPNFGLALTYVDVAGKAWITRADYIARGDGSYVGMSIEEAKPEAGAPPVRRAVQTA